MTAEDRGRLEEIKRRRGEYESGYIGYEWLLLSMLEAAEAQRDKLAERVRELEKENSILRGLSQRGTIKRGSFAQYVQEESTVTTSPETRAALGEKLGNTLRIEANDAVPLGEIRFVGPDGVKARIVNVAPQEEKSPT